MEVFSSDSHPSQDRRPKVPPTLKNNVASSRKCLTYKRNNIVHFIAKDCIISDTVGLLLTEIGAIDPKGWKTRKPQMGQIFTTLFKNHNVFSLVVKERHLGSTDWVVVKSTLQRLRRILLRKNLSSFRIARRSDLIDEINPGCLIEELSNIFSGTPIDVTVCYGQVELPKLEERKPIIETLHDSFIGGHKGINQTYRKIRERYYWPCMRNDILDYVRRCPQCQEKKIERIKTREPMIITDTPIEAFDKVSIDTVGKLRTTPRGNCHLLTMQCNLTKYLIAIPTQPEGLYHCRRPSQTPHMPIWSTKSHPI